MQTDFLLKILDTLRWKEVGYLQQECSSVYIELGFALNWSIAHEDRTRVGLQD